MSPFKLTEQNLETLKKAEFSLCNRTLWKRTQCIRMKHEQLSHQKISRILSVCPKTVGNWIKTYKEGGLKALLSWGYKGRSSQLQSQDRSTIIRWHKQVKPFQKAKELQQFIEEHVGIHFHLHWVQTIAKKRLKIDFKLQETEDHKSAQRSYARFVQSEKFGHMVE